jgi:oligosaccharide repeat unit polymerase
VMNVFEKCLALVFSLMILGQAYLVRRYVGTWLFPACLFGLFWFGYTFVPLAILFWVPVDPYAIAFIFLCTLAFSMGSLPFDWKTAFEKNARKGETAALVYGSPFLKAVFYVSTLSSLVFLILNSLAQDISLHSLFFDLIASSGAYAELRYSESINVNIFGQLSLVCAYLGTILGGFLFSCMPTKTGRRLIVVLSFLPSIFVAVTQSAKGALFLCIAFFYAALLVYRASVGKLRLFEKGNIKSLTLCVAVLMLIVTISFISRGLYHLDDTRFVINRLIFYFASYSFSHIYAFSDWFAFIIGSHSEFAYTHEGATYGFYTFMPLFKLMGSHKVVPQGVFDEYYSYGELLTGNIYTMFRGLILDFGFIGSVLFMLVTGLLLHLAFRNMLLKRRPVFTVASFVFMMGYFYNSSLISLLIWNNIYATFFLVCLVLQINKLISQRGGRRLAPSELPTSAATRPGLLRS